MWLYNKFAQCAEDDIVEIWFIHFDSSQIQSGMYLGNDSRGAGLNIRLTEFKG